MLNNFLIKHWSTSKALKKKHVVTIDRRAFCPFLCSSHIFCAKFLYQLRRNDVYNFHVIATTNELHSLIGAARAFAGRKNSPEDLLDRADNLFPIVTVPGNEIRAGDPRAQRNPDSDRLRLKGSLASSFTIYLRVPDCRCYCHNFAIIRLGNSRLGRSFPFDSQLSAFPLSPSHQTAVKQSGL